MGEPFVGEIRMFGGSFAPAGWAFCSGQLMPISENETLFNLIGTTYGGDGQETFALPDLQGRIPIHAGTGNFGITFQLGEKAGSESVTLTTSQIPLHTHSAICTDNTGDQAVPTNNIWAGCPQQVYVAADQGFNFVNMKATIARPTGGSQPHENMAPFLVVSFIISLFGVFPSQN
jgi:microcystin-dependent protein